MSDSTSYFGASSLPHFGTALRRLVLSFPTQERCILQALDETIALTHEDETIIAAICNEPLIYDRLFHRRLNGQLYSIGDAQGFLRWAQQGWSDHSWFVFLLRNSNDQIVGAVDIKSAHTDGAEIGYWASASSPGVMTNAVLQVCEVAKEAGYRRLFALIAPDNERSLGVVRRAGFVQTEDVARGNASYLQFARSLI